MTTIEDIIASARLREETATICVAGDLNAEHERLVAELSKADDDWKPTKLGDVDPRRELAEQIKAVEQRMKEHEHTFVFRAMPHKAFRALKSRHTSDGGVLDVDEFLPVLIVECCVEPKIGGRADWDRLDETLTQGQFDRLAGAAWAVNTEQASVPKSVRASALTATSEQK